MRQQNTKHELIQQQFIELLPRIRDGKMTIDDWKVLLSIKPTPANTLLFENSYRLFIDNKSAFAYNDQKLQSLNSPLIHLVANNSKKSTTYVDDDCFRGLVKSFYLCLNANIVFTSNLWTEMGIVNGAFGVFSSTKNPYSLPEIILVEIKDYIGPQLLTKQDVIGFQSI